MQRGIPHRTWPPTTTAAAADASVGLQSQPCDSSCSDSINDNNTNVRQLVSDNAVIVFGRPGCCMCHVVDRLLLGLGVNPTIFVVDEADEAVITDQLSRIIGGDEGGGLQFPAVFVGGKLFGGLERVMATHISGELVPILKVAGALWL